MQARSVELFEREGAAVQGVDGEFVRRVLKPYVSKNCVYLKSCAHSFEASVPQTRASFSIPESCYIDSTGHFNAVELNICYNQMFYVLWADGVHRRLIREAVDWDLAEFGKRQLPNMLIVKVQSSFKRAIDPRAFQAVGQIDRVRAIREREKKLLFVKTHATFSDASGGLARAEVDFALV